MAHTQRRQQRRTGFRNKTKLQEGRGEHGACAGHHVIAMKQHRSADTDRDAVDRGDQRFLSLRQRPQKLMRARIETAR